MTDDTWHNGGTRAEFDLTEYLVEDDKKTSSPGAPATTITTTTTATLKYPRTSGTSYTTTTTTSTTSFDASKLAPRMSQNQSSSKAKYVGEILHAFLVYCVNLILYYIRPAWIESTGDSLEYPTLKEILPKPKWYAAITSPRRYRLYVNVLILVVALIAFYVISQAYTWYVRPVKKAAFHVARIMPPSQVGAFIAAYKTEMRSPNDADRFLPRTTRMMIASTAYGVNSGGGGGYYGAGGTTSTPPTPNGREPSSAGQPSVYSPAMMPIQDVNNNGIDDDLEERIQEEQFELLRKAYGDRLLGEDDDDEAGDDASSASSRVLNLPPLWTFATSLCGPLGFQMYPDTNYFAPVVGCWDAVKYLVEIKYNPRGSLAKQVAATTTSLDLGQRRRKLEAIDNMIRIGAPPGSREPICITSTHLGMTAPFIVYGYAGYNMTLMIAPEVVPLEAGLAAAQASEHMPAHKFDFESSQVGRTFSQQQLQDTIFKQLNVAERTIQPDYGVRIKYWTLPPDEDLKRYYTQRMGPIYESWTTATGIVRQEMRNDIHRSNGWFMNLLHTILTWVYVEHDDETHNKLIFMRSLIEYERKRIDFLYRSGGANGAKFEPDPLLMRYALTVSPKDYSYFSSPAAPPQLVQRIEHIDSPFSRCIMTALSTFQGLEHRRREVHEYYAGIRKQLDDTKKLVFDFPYLGTQRSSRLRHQG